MKNENFGFEEMENLLKTKMNELSDSVDCFDKISARAFPKEQQDFSESGFTVSDLENITGKSQRPHLLKWTALAAAAVVCVAVLPKTGFVRQIFANLGSGSVKKIYQQLITEINTELESGNYITIDVPLEYYISNDVVVTPLFSCPFEDCGKQDANVRLFIKQIDGINTTQMYAALYCGTYSENNIIAAAESDFKFTSDDMEHDFRDIEEYQDQSLITAEKLFLSDENGLLLDNDGNAVSLASFSYPTIIKDQNGIRQVTSEILYGHKEDSKYFYDITTTYLGSKDTIPERNEMWKKSVYFNGNSAFPKEDRSGFIRESLFDSSDLSSDAQTSCDFIMPASAGNWIPQPGETLTMNSAETGAVLGTIKSPVDVYAAASMKLYFSSSIENSEKYGYSNNVLKLNSSEIGFIKSYKKDEINSWINDTDEMLKRLQEQQELQRQIEEEKVLIEKMSEVQ